MSLRILLLTTALCLSLPATADIVVTNVRLVDGTGTAASAGELRIAGGLIAAVGPRVPREAGDEIVDGGGQVLAPGFIDSHSHLDRTMFATPDVPGAVNQGVTTIIIGQDGYSELPTADLKARLAASPVAVNVGTYSGHNDLRRRVMGDRRDLAGDGQLLAMEKLLDADMRAGSMGLSTGLIYVPGVFSDTREVLALARVAAAHGGRYISHIRNEADQIEAAVEEFLLVGRTTGMPVKLSHIKIAIKSKWGQAPAILARLDQARAEGMDVTADIYPYIYWQTTMAALFPDKNFNDPTGVARNFRETTPPDTLILTTFLADPSLVGKSITQIAASRGQDPVKTYLDLMAQAAIYQMQHPDQEPVERIVGFSMSEQDLTTFLNWPHTNICSDGFDGGHPRGYATFTRILGHYVREKHVLGLEQAVHRMTGLTAAHLGIIDRGLLRPGMAADLVLFDPDTVADRASLTASKALSAGITRVWVNGVPVYEGQRTLGVHPGRFLPAAPHAPWVPKRR